MQKFFDIILSFKEHFILILLIIISLTLLSINDNSQIRAIRSYTIGFVGATHDVFSVIPNIFKLQHENEILRKLNVDLSNEVGLLRGARLENLRLRAMAGLKEHSSFQLVAADVVGKSLHLLRNTLTLDIGENEGVKIDMPIISEAGLVGKIIATSTHYSIGQLMLNKDFRASSKVQRSRVDGIVAWDGGEFVSLKNVSKTLDVEMGDIVITSEYSNLFPPHLKIGHVISISEKPGSLFKEIQVKPSVDFYTLEQVFVITSVPNTERVSIENNIMITK